MILHVVLYRKIVYMNTRVDLFNIPLIFKIL